MSEKPVMLMRGHGNVVVGPNLKIAVYRAVYTEINARLQLKAQGLGGELNFLTPEEGKLAEAVEMRFQSVEILRCQIKRQQVAQAAIDGVKILPATVGRKVARRAIGIDRSAWASRKCVHGDLVSSRDHWWPLSSTAAHSGSLHIRTIIPPLRFARQTICATNARYETAAAPRCA